MSTCSPVTQSNDRSLTLSIHESGTRPSLLVTNPLVLANRFRELWENTRHQEILRKSPSQDRSAGPPNMGAGSL